MIFFTNPSSFFQPKKRINQIWKICVCKISYESHDEHGWYSWNVFEGESVKSNLCEKCVSEISDVSRAEYKWYSVSGPAPDHHTVPLWLMKQYGWRRISPSTPYKQCRNPFFKCSDKRKRAWYFWNFYSTPSTEGVQSTRGNSVCLSVHLSVITFFLLVWLFICILDDCLFVW